MNLGAVPMLAGMPHTRVILQSRLSSTRLPAKALLSLCGRPVAVLAARRAARGGLDVVIATSTDPEDDAIARAAEAGGVACFRGSLEDPLARFAGASADLDDADVVVRLTADNVVPDGDLISGLVSALLASGDEYVRVADANPYGLGGEAFTVGLLRRAHAAATSSYDREHVTPWMRRESGDGSWDPQVPSALRSVRCTIDTLDDFVVAERALAAVADAEGAPWRDLLKAWADAAGPQPVRAATTNSIHQGRWVLGTVQLGVPYGAANTSGLPDLGSSAAVLREAATSGVTHLDTARAYGESESRIGRTLGQGLSERVGVVTKVRPLDDLPVDAPPAWGRDATLASVQRSLRELRSAAIDALLVHRWADWGRGSGAVADTLDALREEGVATLVGASIATPAEALAALGDPRVGYLQLPFNVLDRRWVEPELLDAFAARPDVVVTVRSVFLQGLLAAPAASWPANAQGERTQTCEALDELTVELGRDGWADLALAYVLGHPFVTSVVLGAETPEQVRQQAEWVARPALDTDEAERVRERLPGGSDVLVDPSSWIMDA